MADGLAGFAIAFDQGLPYQVLAMLALFWAVSALSFFTLPVVSLYSLGCARCAGKHAGPTLPGIFSASKAKLAQERCPT